MLLDTLAGRHAVSISAHGPVPKLKVETIVVIALAVVMVYVVVK